MFNHIKKLSPRASESIYSIPHLRLINELNRLRDLNTDSIKVSKKLIPEDK